MEGWSEKAGRESRRSLCLARAWVWSPVAGWVRRGPRARPPPYTDGPTGWLCQLRLRNKMPRLGPKQQTVLSQALEAGSLRSGVSTTGIQAHRQCLLSVSSLRPHTEWSVGALGASFIRRLIASWGLHLMTSSPPRTTPSHHQSQRGLGFHT